MQLSHIDYDLIISRGIYISRTGPKNDRYESDQDMKPKNTLANVTRADIQRDIEEGHRMRNKDVARAVQSGLATLISFIPRKRLVSGSAKHS